ncbi:MAG: TatD family hydrolase [Flavobacteriales bacterium]|jgi:TatD DNase family protein|uniref:TatD family hydrolase n=1 Tax=Blattabacterium sp. (Mastotermes darwiniensis) TaxID=39768 RepID=UPI000231DE05|nr:TatD family hydrolase [Blattabacterium sp. (Mastotermes darwiniensis)]AER40569.1 Sec-independent protein translocase protein TatD [Blattabacterium sp. (Mastotermes darwiniensis) str. MADAR]MDR1805066.1 TatD family hydrolase [Flavobacteriales bacterium]
MKISDTHAHLYMEQFDEDRDCVIKKAIDNGINRFYLPSIDSTNIPKILQLEQQYPNICFPMIGLHPSKVHPNNLEKELNFIKKWLNKHSFISVGEIGMDLHLENKFVLEQEYAFTTQIQLAKVKGLPIVIHCRKAFDQVFNILSKENNSSMTGIFHCFYGTLEQAKKIVDFGLKLGIGGMITFKNNKLRTFLHKISLKNIVLETDSPYLSPYPFRGKRNEPFYLKIVLTKMSQIYSISEEEIANVIDMNVKELFRKG